MSCPARPVGTLCEQKFQRNVVNQVEPRPSTADQNKKRLSLDSTNKKHERDSLMSRNSLSKKVSKNQIGID